MSENVQDRGRDATREDTSSSFHYPWAGAPDIIRANQKDAYFQSELLTKLSAVIRSLYGARAEHQYANEASVFTELLYLALTTFIGNRTLGEEYCDIVQVEDDTHRLPALHRRAGYILSSVLLPYLLTRGLPAFRRRIRAKLEVTLKKAHRRRVSSPTRMKQPPPPVSQFQDYLLRHLDAITSPAPVYAVGLAVFYFTGAYYQLSKRIFGLRYIFTRRVDPSDARAGYEVLGVLLVVQMLVQSYLHLQATYRSVQVASAPLPASAAIPPSNADPEGDATAPFFNTPLLFEPPPPTGADPEVIKQRVSATAHTPLAPEGQYHVHLENDEVLRWVDGDQQRKCTLCLEPMKDPSVTTCGHAFCWVCVTDWLREQPMCPLCRQTALVQHVLPLRG